MTKALKQLNSNNLFQLDPSSENSKDYEIYLNEDDLEKIKVFNEETYQKILDSKITQINRNEDGEIIYPVALKLRKIKDLSVREKRQFKDAMTPAQQVGFIQFLSSIKTKYYIEDLNFYELLNNKELWAQFDLEEQTSMSKYAKLIYGSSQEFNIHNVSIMLQARVHPTWSFEDTDALSEELFNKFLFFLDGEMRKWEVKKPITQHQTIAIEKQKKSKHKKN